jgi:phospholipase C
MKSLTAVRVSTCILATAFQAAALACAHPNQTPPYSDRATLAPIGHVVVIYLENRSFDNLYGDFPGADGLAAARASGTEQVDASGAPYATLPQAAGTPFPNDLPNAPFDITRYVPADQPTRDLVHRYYQERAQIDGGRMDKYALVSDAKGLVMGY